MQRVSNGRSSLERPDPGDQDRRHDPRSSTEQFPGPQVVEEEIEEFYGVTLVGRLESVRETFYAISPEQQLKHPAVVQIVESAHDELFA